MTIPSKWKALLLGLAIAFSLYLIVGFFVLSPLAQYMIRDSLEPNLGLSIVIEDIKTNPLTFEVELNQLEISEEQQTLLSIERFYVDLSFIKFLTGMIEIESLAIEKPVVTGELNKAGEFNLVKPFLSQSDDDSQPAETENESMSWHIKALVLKDGMFYFRHISTTGEYRSHSQRVNLSINELNPNTYSPFELNLDYDKKSPISLTGKISLQPFTITGELSVKQLEIAPLMKYAKHHIGGKIHQGFLSGQLDFNIDMTEDFVYQIKDSQLTLSNLNYSLAQEEFIKLQSFDVSGIYIDSHQQQISINQCIINKTNINVFFAKNGELNISQITPDASLKKQQATHTKQSEASNQADQWQFTMEHCQLTEGHLTFKDNVYDPAVKEVYNNIDITLENISTKPDSSIKLQASLNMPEDGLLTIDSQIKLHEQDFIADVKLENKTIKNLQGYINEFAHITINDGKANSQLHIEYNPKDKPLLSVTGDISLDKFKAQNNKTNEDLIGWEKIKAHQIQFSLSPSSLNIPIISISQSDTRIAINKQGELNLLAIVKSNETNKESIDSSEKKSDEATPAIVQETNKRTGQENVQEVLPIIIDELRFENNIVRFSDESLLLPFITHISKIEGSIKPLAINKENNLPADINLKGQIDKYGIATLNGSLNTSQPQQFAALKLLMENVALDSLSPYSGTFSGYKLDSGKLDTTVNYKVNNQKLNSDNDITIRDIKLGIVIDKDKADRLPLQLAIALLEDRNGKIAVNLPISGDMSDPEFKYSHLIGQALANLIVKVVASPFTLLGKLGGGSKDIQFMRFTAGSSKLRPPQKESLLKLANALKERKMLDLYVPLCSKEKEDTNALKQAILLQKLNASNKDKADFYTDQFISLYSKKIYYELKVKHTKKIDDKIQLNMPGYVQSMESKILEKLVLDANTVKQLVQARFQIILEFLKQQGKLEHTRIKQGEQQAGKWVNDMVQCQFSLKTSK